MSKVLGFKKYLNARTMTPIAIARKHGVSLGHIMAQLKMGIAVEKEHTKDPRAAKEVALDHLGEDENYYTKLKRMEGSKH